MGKILIINKDYEVIDSVYSILTDYSFDDKNIITANNAWDALTLYKKYAPPLVIVGDEIDIITGCEFISKLRQLPTSCCTKIISLVEDAGISISQLYSSGCDNCFEYPIKNKEIFLSVVDNYFNTGSKIYEYLLDLKKDGTTGLFNKETFYAMLKQQLSLLNRKYLNKITVAIVDIDYFKKINDKYGHVAGDSVLREFSEILQNNLRTTDMIFRFGGEEFGIIFPNADKNTSMRVLERVRKIVEKKSFCNNVSMTFSAGIYDLYDPTIIPEVLINRADNALYEAKKSGRNKICIGNEI